MCRINCLLIIGYYKSKLLEIAIISAENNIGAGGQDSNFHWPGAEGRAGSISIPDLDFSVNFGQTEFSDYFRLVFSLTRLDYFRLFQTSL